MARSSACPFPVALWWPLHLPGLLIQQRAWLCLRHYYCTFRLIHQNFVDEELPKERQDMDEMVMATPGLSIHPASCPPPPPRGSCSRQGVRQIHDQRMAPSRSERPQVQDQWVWREQQPDGHHWHDKCHTLGNTDMTKCHTMGSIHSMQDVKEMNELFFLGQRVRAEGFLLWAVGDFFLWALRSW